MSEHKMRIAIAETQGYKGCTDINCDWRNCDHLHKDEVAYFPEWFSTSRYPDYPNDLNAMHGAEKSFNKLETMKYQSLLVTITCNNVVREDAPGWCDGYLFHATARQRAEAFLRTLGLFSTPETKGQTNE